MNTSIRHPDATPPSRARDTHRDGWPRQGSACWGAATRQRGSSATTSIARRRPASRRRPPTGSRSPPARATPTRARGRQLLLQGHSRGRGRQRRAASNEASDSRRPTRRRRPHPRAWSPTGAPGQVALSWTASTDTSASRATTSTARRRPASPRACQPDRTADGDELHRHGPRGRHLLLQGHRRGRRRQPQRAASNEATASGLERHRRPASSPPTASTKAPARRPPTSPAPATTARSANATWAAQAPASSATRSPSTARTPRSPSPDSTRST